MRWREVIADASLAERTLDCQAGMPMATRMPMIEMTIISSTSEKPRWRKIFLFVLILLNLTAFTVHVSNGSEFHKAAKSSGGAAVRAGRLRAEKFYYTEPRKSHRHQKQWSEAGGQRSVNKLSEGETLQSK